MGATADRLDFAEAIPIVLRTARAKAVSMMAASGDRAFERDDFVQESLIAVWRRLRRYDPRRSSLQTFIDRIVTSAFRSILRRQRAAKRNGSELFPKSSSVDSQMHIEIQIRLRRAFRGLNPIDRGVARLLLCEYRPAEIGPILRISRTAVYRCIDRIRVATSVEGFA